MHMGHDRRQASERCWLMRNVISLLVILFSLAPSSLGFVRAAEPNSAALPTAEEALPPPLTHYKGREIAQTMHYLGAPWLVRESREREEDCTALLEALDVKAGQVICDLGWGSGFYTVKLARLVGETGRVLAVD